MKLCSGAEPAWLRLMSRAPPALNSQASGSWEPRDQQSQALHPVWNARQRDAALGTPCGLLTGRARVLVCRQGEEGWGQGETAEGEAEVPTELSSSQVPPTFAQAAPLPP